MLGAKTIGNATLLAFDGGPVLVTDPWLGDEHGAYFGSWELSHEIPCREKAEIQAAPWVWFSHGHPDHLNPRSVERFRGRTILLSDHVGGRLRRDLSERGFDVRVLPEREWVELSPRIRVFSMADALQDSALLLEIGGSLFINLNDCRATGCARLIRRIAARYERSYVMRLTGYGDADMINFFDGEGTRQPPPRNPVPVGRQLSDLARRYGATHVVPFSSFHRYRRSDSTWANRYTTPMTAYTEGFDAAAAEYVEPFSIIEAETGRTEPIRPDPLPERVSSPEEFGDSWSDELDKQDEGRVAEYFRRKELLHDAFGFIDLAVGGKTLGIRLGGPAYRGITFEVPRNSLMQAVEYEIFDDLLIGNFMRTTLHGARSLYEPDFTLTVAKFADNGRAETRPALRAYLREYRRRGGFDLACERLIEEAARALKRRVGADSGLYRTARQVYFRLA